ncbi:MAG: DUF1700 domain-containing protein [Oscillospiraceae bacterium]|nr:DUF1700 domain-containing protein [Oscillospiraceae bacterium]
MITNSKKDFFGQLKYELERIGMQLSDDIRIDFEEHFAECKDEGVSESEAAKRLGDVKTIARNYLNLESSRINSMVARDIEHRVSLTKPGRDVPADLSLLKDRHEEENDYEHIIEYTPEHFSEEIYPQAENSQRQNNFTVNSSANSENNSGAAASSSYVNNSQRSGAGDQNVADAFSNAGRAVADAAKVTGSAIADAFGNSGVKKAVVNAGKTTADAMKSAGHSAAEAVRNASQNVADKVRNGVPHPSDKIRENTNNSRKGTIPNNPNNKSAKKGAGFISVKGLKPNVNAKKLVRAILLDVLLWIWLLPSIIGLVIGIFFGGFEVIGSVGIPVLMRYQYRYYYEVVSFFWGIANISLGFIISLIGICLVKPVLKLVRFIINQHIKAIYDL